MLMPAGCACVSPGRQQVNPCFLLQPWQYLRTDTAPLDLVHLQEGKQAGLDDGINTGFAQGKEAGFNEGVNTGFQQGKDAGFNQGIESGFQVCSNLTFSSMSVLLYVC
jgi:hypothetical protein